MRWRIEWYGFSLTDTIDRKLELHGCIGGAVFAFLRVFGLVFCVFAANLYLYEGIIRTESGFAG